MAAKSLARKIAVLAWVLLRDGTDWDPKQMLEVTESFGRISPALKETLTTMKPNEKSDQHKVDYARKHAKQILLQQPSFLFAVAVTITMTRPKFIFCWSIKR